MQCPGVLFFQEKFLESALHMRSHRRVPRRIIFSGKCFFTYFLCLNFFKECLSVGQKERGRIGRAFSAAERTAKEGAGLRRGGDFLKKRTKNRKGCKIALQIAEGLVK